MSSNSSNSSNTNPFTNKAYSANYDVLRKAAQNLPVSQQLPQLLSTIKRNNVVVVVGETGSGKTTQLPKALLLDEEFRKSGKEIALTQNRRLAAQLVAERIAEEMDVQVGHVVGLKHRGCDLTNQTTRLDVVTDGSLLVAAKNDTSLSVYGAIVIDEAHQHTIGTDILLGLLRDLAEKRKDDLKIIIMSATIDADLFLKFFPRSVLETVQGRSHKVITSYLAEPPHEDTLVESILRVHLYGRSGNILVFVSGVGVMLKIIEKVGAALSGPKARFDPHEIGPLDCYPLHASLSAEAQEEAVESIAPLPRNGHWGRKLLVATNIAETSVTLAGITHVIDSCKVKRKIWISRDESWCLREKWVSKAVARQRAGRVSRTREGMAYRMCTEGGFLEKLSEHSVPAILEGDMLSECLDILKMGYNPLNFPYIVAPATETVVKALGILLLLGAVDRRGDITPRGENIARLPTDVYSAVVLLESPRFGCSDEILSLISMIEASEGGLNVFVTPKSSVENAALKAIRGHFGRGNGDHITLFNVYMSWRQACASGKVDEFLKENKLQGRVLREADHFRLRLLRTLRTVHNWKLRSLHQTDPQYYSHILQALAAGSYLRIAKRESTSRPRAYETLRHRATVHLKADTDIGPPSLDNEWVIYNEYYSDGGLKKNISLVSPIAPELMIQAQVNYWWDVEFIPNGHVKDGLIKVISEMTGKSEAFIRGGMPKRPVAVTPQEY